MPFKSLSLLAAVLIALAGCGGDNLPVAAQPVAPEPPVTPPVPPEPPVTPPVTPPVGPTQPDLPLSIKLMGICVHPRTGNRPDGLPYLDRQGTLEDEKRWVAAFIDESYLWYKEVPTGLNPASYSTPVDYFNALKTPAITASGRAKDRFHFTYPSAVWDALSNSGASIGYGMTLVRYADTSKPRVWKLTMVEPGSPAEAAGLQRGDRLFSVDYILVSDYGATPRATALINAGLFPAAAGEKHRLLFARGDVLMSATMVSQTVGGQSVRNTKVIETPTGKVGYLQFNEHNAIAESQLVKAFGDLRDAGVSDLVLDMRYNGGGMLTIASELAYMIAGPQATDGKIFERVVNNGKTASPPPIRFQSKAFGFAAPAPVPAGSALPYLGLSRVTVLTTPGTCSASESVINSLRGVGVEVNLIGGETCGKPYAFVPAPNCGTTYFAIETQGVNDKGEGDYADGFQPTCRANDDLQHALGDPQEGLLAAALSYRANGSCPTPQAARQLSGATMQVMRPPIQEIAIDDRKR